MSSLVNQDSEGLQQLQMGSQSESTSGYDGRELRMDVKEPVDESRKGRSGSPILLGQVAGVSSGLLSSSNQPRVQPSRPSGSMSRASRSQVDEPLHGNNWYPDTRFEAKFSGNDFGLVNAHGGNNLVHRDNTLTRVHFGNLPVPDPKLRDLQNHQLKVHEYAQVNLDSQHDFGTILNDGSVPEMFQRASYLAEPVRSGRPGHLRGHEPEYQQSEASSKPQVKQKLPSTEKAERGRRAGRHGSSKASLPDPEALARGRSSSPCSASQTPISRNAYSVRRATTNIASSSSSLSTAGTFAFNTTMIAMAIIALVFAIVGYKVGVASAQSGDRALKLSMWEDCIEHSDILANSATCKKLLDQGFDAIVSGTRRPRDRRGLEGISNRCPYCLRELGVG